MKTKTRQELLSEEQAEGFLEVSRTTLWRLRRSGTLPFYKIGSKVRYAVEDLREWLDEQRGVMAVHESAADYAVTKPAGPHESGWKVALESQDWSFHDEFTTSLTHGIHPYPAKFPPQIPARLIEILTQPGDVVLDPFCGSGTTLVEAVRLDRAAVGSDINPVAVLVTEAKTARLDVVAERVLDELEQAVDSDAARERGQPLLFSEPAVERTPVGPPSIPNLERWFEPVAIKEIGLVLARIESLQSDLARRVARSALSSILVAVSNQDSETRYTARPKALAAGDVLACFLRKLREVSDVLIAFREVSAPREARVLLADARYLPADVVGRVDAVVTSPPYANAFDYHLYHRHRMYWLGYDPGELRRQEIGSHLNYQRRGNGIETYRSDMQLCLKSIAMVLKPGGACAFVVGDSVFFGKVVDNAGVIVSVSSGLGFRCLTIVERRIHPVKRSMIKPARRARVEKIVLLVRQ
ncbi:MAG: DNA methyltransferase [Chromatiales bacterium]